MSVYEMTQPLGEQTRVTRKVQAITVDSRQSSFCGQKSGLRLTKMMIYSSS